MRYSDAVKTARMQAVLDALKGGELRVMDAGGAVLAVLPLEKIAGSVAGLRLALRLSEAEATAKGNAARAALMGPSGELVVGDLTVGQAGADIQLDNTAIAVGQRVKVPSLVLVHT